MALVKYRLKQGAEFQPFDYRPSLKAGEITDNMVEWYAKVEPEKAAKVFEGIEDLLQIEEIKKATPKAKGYKEAANDKK